MTVIFLSILYFVSARSEYRRIFEVSVWIRFAVPCVFAALVVAGFAPWNLILLTPLDVVFAIWTLVALRESSAPAQAMA